MKNPSRIPLNAALCLLTSVLCLLAHTARAWDYAAHRAINLAALSAMPADFPAFLKTPAARERISYLAGEPDRWRNSYSPSLRHINQIEHFFDMEELDPLGMKFADLSQFRYTFIQQLTLAQARHPEVAPKIPPDKDKDATAPFPGFLPWAIAENYGKLQSGFSTLRAFEQHGGTPVEIANARENVAYIMGRMGHYVADSVQPLHITKHYNGWVGDNPRRYTTSRGFHAWIDNGFLAKTGPLDTDALTQRMKPAQRLSYSAEDPANRDPIFVHIIEHMQRQLPKVEQLYALDKAGKLDAESPGAKEGRAFLEDQLLTGAQFLAALWYTACKTAPDDTYLIKQLETRKAAAAQ